MTKQPTPPRSGSTSSSKRSQESSTTSSKRSNSSTSSGSSSSSRPASSRSSSSSTGTRPPSARSTASASSGAPMQPRPPRKSTPKKQPVKPQPEGGLPAPVRAFLEDPDALRNLRHYLPNWIDEVLAALFICTGAVMLASLLSNGAEGELSSEMSHLLRQGFGDGAPLISLAVLIGGFLILLPKIGVRVSFSLGRVVALELAFICFQGILHILPFTTESKALAREGGGGGYVGWAVSGLLTGLLGNTVSLIILGIILIVSIHWLLNIRRAHYRQVFQWFSDQIRSLATRIESPVTVVTAGAAAASTAAFIEDDDDYAYEEPVQPQVIVQQPAYVPEPAMAAAPPPFTPAIQAAPISPPPDNQLRRRSVVQREEQPRQGRTSPPPLPPLPVQPAAEIPPQPLPVVQQPPAAPPPVMSQPPVPPPAAPPATASLPPAEPEEDVPVPQIESRPVLMVNGQAINPATLNKERPSLVPRNGSEPRPAAVVPPNAKLPEKRHTGGRDGDPSKRYFTIDALQERVKIAQRAEALPPLELLHKYDHIMPAEAEINRNASIIENTLLEFDIDADVIDVKVGPVVTQYAVSPIKEIYNPETRQSEIKRVRVDRIVSLQSDLALALSAKTLRIEAPVPGHSYVGIEVPNSKASTVGLRPVVESETFFNTRARKSPLTVPLGRDVSGDSVVIDLAQQPHLLIAGTTGSGKSICLTSLVASLVMNNTPHEVKLVMLDPKRVELTRFNGLPHLLGPVEIEADRIIGVLRWVAREMDRRYKLLELENARNIEAYNVTLGRRRREEHLPYMVVIFDEIGDLMMSHPDETETTVTRLAQKARAAGIHLVIATQRPSVDVLTGLIKANFPGRISFAVASGTDSRVILDHTGAETLLGRGDMLYLAPDAAAPKRVQGCYISDQEVEEITMYWRGWHQEMIAEEKEEAPRIAPWERGITRLEALSEQDPMLEEAIALVCEAREASTSMIQRRLGIGYPRAARLMDLLHELGVIGPPKAGGRAREVLVRNYKEALSQVKRNR